MIERLRLAAAAILATSSVALAGPEWVEQGDAGAGVSDAQTTVGVGPVSQIRGKLGGLEGGGVAGLTDFQDVYLIFIETPTVFQATTEAGLTEFQSRLYLFEADGSGLLANETASGAAGDVISSLPNVATDGTGVVVLDPGLYLLAITVSPFGPVCGGSSIFALESPGEVSGPDGPAAPGCTFDDWVTKLVLYGACCFDEGAPCELLTEDECGKAGGSYLGNGTLCEECPPLGACCTGKGCILATAALCDEYSGSYQGDGTTCDPDPCLPVGACCAFDGTCTETDEFSCADGGGLYQGNGSTCVGVGGCIGACTFPIGNTAGGGFDCIETSELGCMKAGGTYVGNGSACDEGACCVGGECIQTTSSDCANLKGSYQDNATICTPLSCTFASRGAGGPGGPIGAGGVAGTGGGNYVIHLSAVTFATPPAGIPTLGEWGLIILGIGLVIAMTILIRRVM